MKCDNLKAFNCVESDVQELCDPRLVYSKPEVDAAIAELKSKLESVQATAYTESVDAGMRERKLKRSLWLARAERANATWQKMLRDAGIFFAIGKSKEWDFYNTKQKKWQRVETKCRAKAKEYK